MNAPLMRKATALWLVENTSLTFQQIADFCMLHILEIKRIGDGELKTTPYSPIANNQLTREMIISAEENPSQRLELCESANTYLNKQKKENKIYTPIARRQDKPDAIAWLVKNHPELTDRQITRLIGTTKKTIESIRDKTHRNMAVLEPRDPVLLGLCTQTSLGEMSEKSLATLEKQKQNKE